MVEPDVLSYGRHATQTPAVAAGSNTVAKSPPRRAKVKTRGTARKEAGWTRPTDRFFQHQAPLIDALMREDHSISSLIGQGLDRLKVDGNLSVLGHEAFLRLYRGLPGRKTSSANSVGGVTDKKKGQAYLHDFHDRGSSTVEAALHETVHLLAHPPGAARTRNAGKFRDTFGSRFDEGVTQYFTTILMLETGFRRWQTEAYSREFDLAVLLIGWLGRDANELMALAYFQGRPTALLERMNEIWGPEVVLEWRLILANENKKIGEATRLLIDSPQLR